MLLVLTTFRVGREYVDRALPILLFDIFIAREELCLGNQKGASGQRAMFEI